MDKEIITNPFDNRSPFEVLERSRRERLLYAISTTAIPTLIPILAVYIWMSISRPSWQIVFVCILTILICIISFISSRLAQHQQSESGSYLFLFSILLIIGLNAIMVEGLIAVLALSYAVMIIMAGMLLGRKGSLVIAVTAAFLWIMAQIITVYRLIPPAMMTGALLSIIVLVITVAGFLFTAFISQLAMQDLRRALDDATYELVQANRKLGDANRMKSQFLARTSHELRTPLNAIIGYTDLTLRRIYGSLTAMQEDGLKRVLSNAKRLQTLINDILDLSKIEAGELELADTPFDTKSLVDAVDTAVGEIARKKGLEFSISLAPDMPEKIVGDEIRAAQIALNLTDNAVKFTPEGQVSVSIGLINDTHWRIQVQDTGRGIREEDFERIFQEFQQVGSPSAETQPRGSGLGLAITRHLVHKMGGEIKVSSELGKGSTFEVTLPLKVPQADNIQTQM